MPRNIALLSAVVLISVLLLAGGRASAAPVQPFTTTGAFEVDWTTCFGGAAPAGGTLACGAGSSDSALPADTALDAWQVVHVPPGSRLVTQTLIYTPFGAGTWQEVTPACAPYTGTNDCTAGDITGDISIQTDIGCSNGAHDIIASPASGSGSWPGGTWDPYDLVRTADAGGGEPASGSPNGYVSQVRPQPASFTFVSLDSTTLTHVWIGGITLMPLIVPLPYHLHTATSPYSSSVRVTATLVGDPRIPPTDDYTCFDSPQDSVTRVDYLKTPLAPGLYPRWAVMQAAGDIVDGALARILDYQCVNVGAFAADDDDNDCLQDAASGGTDANDANADQDGDGVPDGVEAAASMSLTSADADGDGANDYVELAQMTDPAVADTDGDGSKDKLDTGADEDAPASPPSVLDTTADDNCPTVANPSQANSESIIIAGFVPLAYPTGDGTEMTSLQQNIAVLENPTSIEVASTSGFGPNGQFTIENAGSWAYSAIDSTHFLGTTRLYGSAAATVGAAVRPVFPIRGSTLVVVVVENEHVRFTSSGVVRGADGTTAAPHAAGVLWTLIPFASDATFPDQDIPGDACDPDDDNDDLHDLAEAALTIVPWSGLTDPGGSGDLADTTVCAGAGVGVAPAIPINPLDRDSDDDIFLDGAECQMSTRPDLADPAIGSCTTAPVDPDGCALQKPPPAGGDPDQPAPNGDKLYHPTSASGHVAAEAFYRTRQISLDGATQAHDTDGDGFAGDNDKDSDGDRIEDGPEVWSYGTSPANPDTDGDGCTDGKEAADVNGNRTVNAQDLALIASRLFYSWGGYRAANGTITALIWNLNSDQNDNANSSTQDLGLVAAQTGHCNNPPGGPSNQQGRVITNQTKLLP